MTRKKLPLLFAALAVGLLVAGPAWAARPYVVLRDVGGLAAAKSTNPNVGAMSSQLLDSYAATGLPLPEIFSVWTTFPMTGNGVVTYADPHGNDVQGIGLDDYFPPNGLLTSSTPPLQIVLWHNDVLTIDQRANVQHAPVEGFARYLFLLELTHLWGPALRTPAPDSGALIGFPYHWSFFSLLPSPAGGNAWTDNGDGSFTVVPGTPLGVQYSMLDLYVMGLADAAEVPPFGVLENVTAPATPTDPLWGGAFAAHSFPWFDQKTPPLTVTATKKTFTIDDVVAANGPRSPAPKTKTKFSVGFVLMVPESADDTQIASAQATFDPIVQEFAPAFSQATSGRGSLDVVTQEAGGAAGAAGASGAGGAAGSGGATGGTSGSAGKHASATSDDGGGCSLAAGRNTRAWLGFLLCLALANFVRRRRRGHAATNTAVHSGTRVQPSERMRSASAVPKKPPATRAAVSESANA